MFVFSSILPMYLQIEMVSIYCCFTPIFRRFSHLFGTRNFTLTTTLFAGRQIRIPCSWSWNFLFENKTACKGDWTELEGMALFWLPGERVFLPGTEGKKSNCLILLNEMSAFPPYTRGSQSVLARSPPQVLLPEMYFY